MRFNKLQNSFISSAQPLEARVLLVTQLFYRHLDLGVDFDILDARLIQYEIALDLPADSKSTPFELVDVTASNLVVDAVRSTVGSLPDPRERRDPDGRRPSQNVTDRNRMRLERAVTNALAPYAGLMSARISQWLF